MTEEVKIGKIVTFGGKRVGWPLWSENLKLEQTGKGTRVS